MYALFSFSCCFSCMNVRRLNEEAEKMAALGGGRDGRQLCSVLCNLEAVCYSQQAEPSGAGPLCAGPGSLITPHFLSLRGSQANLLARDLILVFGRPLFPTLCHYAAQIGKTCMQKAADDGGGSRRVLLCFECIFGFCFRCFGAMLLQLKKRYLYCG